MSQTIPGISAYYPDPNCDPCKGIREAIFTRVEQRKTGIHVDHPKPNKKDQL